MREELREGERQRRMKQIRHVADAVSPDGARRVTVPDACLGSTFAALAFADPWLALPLLVGFVAIRPVVEALWEGARPFVRELGHRAGSGLVRRDGRESLD